MVEGITACSQQKLESPLMCVCFRAFSSLSFRFLHEGVRDFPSVVAYETFEDGESQEADVVFLFTKVHKIGHARG